MARTARTPSAPPTSLEERPGSVSHDVSLEVDRLQKLLRQRDGEISILVAKLRKERAKNEVSASSGSVQEIQTPRELPRRGDQQRPAFEVPEDRREAFDAFKKEYPVGQHSPLHPRLVVPRIAPNKAISCGNRGCKRLAKKNST